MLGERCLRMAEVGGSTPLISTTDIETVDSLLRVGSFFMPLLCVFRN